MGTISGSELDAWLTAGGRVVTGSDRAARFVLGRYHRARQSEGRTAWIAPRVTHWQAFVHGEWEKRARDGRLVLSSQQELLMWRRIVAESRQPATLLDGPRRKLAGLAMDAHAQICAFAPEYLDKQRRAGWDQDAAVWSGWLEEFDAACRDSGAISADRLALALPSLLDDREERSPLVLAGFDRLTRAQSAVLEAWGEWRELAAGESATNVALYRAPDANSELAACAAWCRQILEAGPARRVLVIAQNVPARRGEMERAFLRESERGADLQFEFSLGIPLSQVSAARSAEMVLRWLDGALEEQELDWLIASGNTSASEHETAELAAAMRRIRSRDRQRTQWSLRAFAAESTPSARDWARRLISVQERLSAAAGRNRGALEWAEIASHLLESVGWPGARPQSSADFQATRRWSQALESCGALGFDGKRMSWSDFVAELRATADDMLFAPESEDAPIVITGPAESAGLEADAIWFLGADQDAWPARGKMNPLLPPAVQRDAAMPHASPALDWELAQTVTNRLLKSAQKVRFSYSAQVDSADTRPSRLTRQMASAPPHLFAGFAASFVKPAAVAYEDKSQVPFQTPTEGNSLGLMTVRGGSGVITAQSNCPFKAFATARLRVDKWETAEPGLTPPERGELVHDVLHSVWAGPPHGLRSLADLRSVEDLGAFVAGHARTAMTKLPHRVRELMPARYLVLEENRLTRLIRAWLELERTRADFVVEQSELDKPANIAGLLLKLRLDRLDQLNDGSFLVIDYKTGTVTDRAWNLPRPEDLQLPLYASYGLDDGKEIGGLVFAKVRPGEDMGFSGSVANTLGTLLPDLGRACALVKKPLEAKQLTGWQDEIEKLARDFLAGRADVDPRDPKGTCERCGLHALCRIQEREPRIDNYESAQEDADA